MPQHVCNGAMLQCTFGAAPSSLIVLPLHRTMTGSQPAANIMDNKPMVNIMPFGVCMSLAFPATASATSAAMGVLTPMPCIPLTTAPWAPGSVNIMLNGQPALNNTSKLMCNWGGVISVVMPGQFTEQVS
jgi:hypothetical protein